MNDLLTKIAILLDTEYKDKVIDEEFIRYIVEEVIKVQGLEKYLENGISINEEDAPMFFARAGYSPKKRKLVVFKQCQKYASYEANVQIKNLPPEQATLATNLCILETLLHELEHVNQERVEEYDNTLEAKLIRLQRGNTEMDSNYELIPSERFAEAKALDRTLTIIDRLCVHCPELRQHFIEKKARHQVASYESRTSLGQSYPIKNYLEVHNKPYTEMTVEEAQENYPSLEDRLYYGLPITAEEYAFIRRRAGLPPVEETSRKDDERQELETMLEEPTAPKEETPKTQTIQ